MSDFTKELVAALKQHHAKVVHTMQIPNNCPTCALILRAEQTPVPSGREWIISDAQLRELWNAAKEHHDNEYALDLGEKTAFMKLRTAPQATMPTQGYSREQMRESMDAAFEWWANGGDSQDGESFAKFEERYLDTITEGGKS